MVDGLSGLTVTIADDVRVLDGGRLLVGGAPMRAVRVGDAGRAVVREWLGDGAIGAGPGREALARRLLDHDILRPRPAPAESTATLTVVVPARDRLAALQRCLTSVRESAPESSLIVVDDGSSDAAGVRAIADRAGATVVRHERARGPGAARNTGLRACATAFVAFVDSDAVVAPGSLERLLGHFADPRLGAVAPRVAALPGSAGAIARYERRHSPLDMGAGDGRVGPGRRIPYVPAVVLLVRQRAAAEADGFDGTLQVGEDVDFVWRLVAAGWAVRYDAGVRVWHDHRDTLPSFLRRRRDYAASIAALARRHPGALPAVRLSRSTALVWLLVLFGHRRLAAVAVAWDVRRAARRLDGVSDRPRRLAIGLVGRGFLSGGQGLARATRRAWLLPLLALAVRRPRTLGLVYAAFIEVIVGDALSVRDPLALVSDGGVRLLDELAALAGTWEGCVRGRALEPLLPRLERVRAG